MITPSQMNPSSPDYFLIDQLEQEIDNAVKRNHRRNLYENRPYEGGFTSTTYPPHICYGVAHKYYNAGWKYVYYKTNTDRNTTAFLLSMTPLDNKITDIASWDCIDEEYIKLLYENLLYEEYELDNQEK